jgi:hypothetical protein
MDLHLIENHNQRNEGMKMIAQDIILTAGGRLTVADGDCAKAKAEIHWARTHGTDPLIRSAAISGSQVVLYTGKWKPVAVYNAKPSRIRVDVELVWDGTRKV